MKTAIGAAVLFGLYLGTGYALGKMRRGTPGFESLKAGFWPAMCWPYWLTHPSNRTAGVLSPLGAPVPSGVSISTGTVPAPQSAMDRATRQGFG